MTDILKSQPILSASTANAAGSPIQVSNCQALSITVRAVVTANDLDADIVLGGTNVTPVFDPPAPLPALTTGKAITVLPAGITFTPATGILAFAAAAVGTHEVTIAFTEFPKWVAANYVYASGGGTVDVQVALAAWSV